jgi:hypothetical protein
MGDTFGYRSFFIAAEQINGPVKPAVIRHRI